MFKCSLSTVMYKLIFYIKEHLKMFLLLLLHLKASRVLYHKNRMEPHYILFNVYFKFE